MASFLVLQVAARKACKLAASRFDDDVDNASYSPDVPLPAVAAACSCWQCFWGFNAWACPIGAWKVAALRLLLPLAEIH